ncbi:polysaccharide pyruvyl transferase family protein [Marinobacter sp. PE14]
MNTQRSAKSSKAARRRPRIAVFGHYGNKNLGDEAIIEAAINNLRHHLGDPEIYCFSIDPFDSARRHGVKAFPIRYRQDFFAENLSYIEPGSATDQALATDRGPNHAPPNTSSSRIQKSWKQQLKSLPLLGPLLKGTQALLDFRHTAKQEIRFLKIAKAHLRGIDLLLVTGSNQFLDNFGGPWGFPYTLMKWTFIAKQTATKVAFISVGAGPLENRLSFRFLKWTLGKADYVSVRDEGSKSLLHSKIGMAPDVFPDIAHKLNGKQSFPNQRRQEDKPSIVAVNPMPVYDKRYWYKADDDKFTAYVDKLSELCSTILGDGHILELFSTQEKDENVIDDIVERLQKNPDFSDCQTRVRITRSSKVVELMSALERADIVVATRFHATVLPLQLGKPVLGICYYRKAAELLDDVGLSEYWVDLDDFTSETLIHKYRTLLKNRHAKAEELGEHLHRYGQNLDRQYLALCRLLKQKDESNE